MNEILKNLHDEPIDIYEEQKRLKDDLSRDRQAKIESRELKSLQSLNIDQHESRENLIRQYYSIINKREETIEGLNIELSGYLQQKEHYEATLPTSHEYMQFLDKTITSNQRSIEDLNENTLELKLQLSQLEEHASTPLEITDANLHPKECFSKAYEKVNQLREAATIFSQGAADKELYNSELKKSVENYAQMVKILKDDPLEVAHETLAQAFENIVKDHEEVAEEYLGIFEEIATSLPKMLHDIANGVQNHTDGMVRMLQIISETRVLNDKMHDDEIVKNILNGSIGKYMQGDIPFINYLNSKGELAIFDIEHVSKEVELGKVKDRGIAELINMLHEDDIQMEYKDVFLLRLLLVEHYEVVKYSIKNKKLDYTNNYLTQHKKLADKASAMGAIVTPAFKNPHDLKIEIMTMLEPHTPYVKYIMEKLLNINLSKLPSK
ncbi:MAG: hypothetical protein Q8J85_04765 [Sulfuricurvum sp.]|nr:hypothetical protein [Sulfuricurvum sp.]MDP3022717.1 hypothetical protein [Sulfuricurvum sp.]